MMHPEGASSKQTGYTTYSLFLSQKRQKNNGTKFRAVTQEMLHKVGRFPGILTHCPWNHNRPKIKRVKISESKPDQHKPN
jgi:hypothetical protein